MTTGTTTTPPASTHRPLADKLSLAAGPGAIAAAMAVMPTGASAGIVASTTLPLSPQATHGSNNLGRRWRWDFRFRAPKLLRFFRQSG